MPKKQDYEVAWVCNGRDPKCKGREGCYYVLHNGIWGSCSHTKDPKYALHKPVRDPKKHKGWFDKFSSEQCTRYYERDSEKI